MEKYVCRSSSSISLLARVSVCVCVSVSDGVRGDMDSGRRVVERSIDEVEAEKRRAGLPFRLGVGVGVLCVCVW